MARAVPDPVQEERAPAGGEAATASPSTRGEPLPPSSWPTSSWVGLAIAVVLFTAAAAALLRPPRRRATHAA